MNGRKDLIIRLAIFVLIMAMTVSVPAVGDTHYVFPPMTIQAAINAASNDDEIEVAPGTYNEAIDFGGKAVRVYSSGGPEVTTIDATGLNTSVVTCNSVEDANTILEGFTITGGSGTTVGAYKYGGGMYNLNSSPTVKNCKFTNNSVTGDGGGMYNNNSSPMVTNCSFSANNADYAGGGMDNRNSSSPMVADCTFSQNTAGTNGGGIENWTDSTPTVTDCSFSGNSATSYGGGMYNYDSSSPTVTDCTFTSNTAGAFGGGMYNSFSSASVTNCTFTGNLAYKGGGVYNNFYSPTVTNCTFSGNGADYGSGMRNWGSSPTMTNCTFSGNTADFDGGGIHNGNSSNPTVVNCILWGNTPDQIVDFNSPESTTTVSFSDVEGGWPGILNIDQDPLFVNALLDDFRLLSYASPCVDTGANGAPGLPATDLAGNPRIVDGDGDGTATVDIGAYEFNGTVRNVTRNLRYTTIQGAIDDAINGNKIEVAPGTYYEAIDFNGNAVRLYSSGGPEVTTIDANGLNSSVVTCGSGEDANTILEGFTITGGSGTTLGGYKYGGGMYNLNSSPTVKDCNFTTNSVTGDGGGMFNRYNSSPTVANCSFAGNSAAYAGGGMDNRNDSSPTVADCTFSQNTAGTDGGGMENLTRCSPTVTNCTFTGNTATSYGGGMYNYDNSGAKVTECTFSGNSANQGSGMLNNTSSPIVINCTFSDNEASINGGGMFNISNSNATVTNCMFSGNSADYGGGMYNNENSPTVTNCKFTANKATVIAGGMSNYNSHPTVTNCTFTGNTASSDTYGGAGMWNHGSSPTVTNCTFTGNYATTTGGGMYNYTNGRPTVTNCILWGNTPDEIFNNSGFATVTYSDVEGYYTGTGNIDADPCFVDPYNPDPNLWNLRLKSDSPCIDAGDTTAVPGGIWADLDGNPRVFDDPETPETGVSLLGLTVDMGTYEFQCSGIAGDINCDGVVDFKDMAILCGNWLSGTEPEL